MGWGAGRGSMDGDGNQDGQDSMDGWNGIKKMGWDGQQRGGDHRGGVVLCFEGGCGALVSGLCSRT